MKHKMIKSFAILSFISGLDLDNANASADKNLFTSADIEGAFRTSFSVPMHFSTDVGELSLAINNEPGGQDMGYMRPHLLGKGESFIEMSHTHFLRRIDQSIMSSQTGSMSEEEGYPEEEYEDAIMPAAQSVSEPILRSACSWDNLPMFPMPTMVVDNPVYPVKYQSSNYWLIDKYALPNSIVTIHWSFNRHQFPTESADLSKFSSPAQFYGYVQNRLLEVVKTTTKAMETDRFEREIRPLMFL